jgi:uncharacterized protein (DUF1778 family)
MPKVLDAMERIKQGAERLVATAAQWNGIDLTDSAALNFAYRAAQLILPDSSNLIQSSVDHASLLTVRRSMDATPTLWNVFNRIQENAINGGLSYHSTRVDEQGIQSLRRNTTRRIRSIDRNVEVNQALWNLAESIAESKAA